MKNDIWSVVVIFNPSSLSQLLRGIGSRPNVIINNSNNNIGYAAGANRGIRKALRSGAEWVIVLNQDIKLTKESFKEFCDKLKKTPPAVAGPLAGSFDSKRWTTILPTNNSVDYISGSMMAIHKDVWKRVGGFYEPYFMYYEDADLSARAATAGFPLVCIPLRIRHKEGFNEYYLARNQLLFVERNAPLGVKIHEFLRLVKTYYEHRISRNSEAALGVRDYMIRRFGRRDI